MRVTQIEAHELNHEFELNHPKKDQISHDGMSYLNHSHQIFEH